MGDMTKATLIVRLIKNQKDILAELSPEEREELWPKLPANFDYRAYFLERRKNLDYVPEGIDVFEADKKIQQEQIDRWLSHNRARGKC